jgi:hypothetical protein
MTNYLLTVIGNFKGEQDCKEMALSITPMVDSHSINYQYSERVLIFHFASETYKAGLYEYIKGVLYGVSESFILTELSDNVSVSFPEYVEKRLFNIESSDENDEMKLDMSRVRNNLDFMEKFDEDSELDENFMAQFWENLKDKIKAPSLDQILDKILCDGESSLTPFEKETLETYSKN